MAHQKERGATTVLGLNPIAVSDRMRHKTTATWMAPEFIFSLRTAYNSCVNNNVQKTVLRIVGKWKEGFVEKGANKIREDF